MLASDDYESTQGQSYPAGATARGTGVFPRSAELPDPSALDYLINRDDLM